jgi:hypothetical protein
MHLLYVRKCIWSCDQNVRQQSELFLVCVLLNGKFIYRATTDIENKLVFSSMGDAWLFDRQSAVEISPKSLRSQLLNQSFTCEIRLNSLFSSPLQQGCQMSFGGGGEFWRDLQWMLVYCFPFWYVYSTKKSGNPALQRFRCSELGFEA